MGANPPGGRRGQAGERSEQRGTGAGWRERSERRHGAGTALDRGSRAWGLLSTRERLPSASM